MVINCPKCNINMTLETVTEWAVSTQNKTDKEKEKKRYGSAVRWINKNWRCKKCGKSIGVKKGNLN